MSDTSRLCDLRETRNLISLVIFLAQVKTIPLSLLANQIIAVGRENRGGDGSCWKGEAEPSRRRGSATVSVRRQALWSIADHEWTRLTAS